MGDFFLVKLQQGPFSRDGGPGVVSDIAPSSLAGSSLGLDLLALSKEAPPQVERSSVGG